MNVRDKEGVSHRETLEGLIARTKDAKRRAKYEAELKCPPFPLPLDYLWRVYRRLSRRVGSSGFGPNPITWPDIDAFVRHAQIRLAPWEIEIIEDLNDLDRAADARAQSTTPDQSSEII